MIRQLLGAFALLAFQGPSAAQPAEGIKPSGLEPVFAESARCVGIASPYASRTRHDGSPRPNWAFGGYHGGIDLSLPEGTPLLALAAGTVASKGEGGMLEGVYIWLRHAPEDTGLSYWVYSKYQHLLAQSDLEVGAKVAVGQVIGRSGKTGTVGKQYGLAGYPHLHLTTRKSARGDESVGSRDETRGMPLFDPLAIYHEAGAKLRQSADSAAQGVPVPIPYVSTDGRLSPPGTRLVWPVACQPR